MIAIIIALGGALVLVLLAVAIGLSFLNRRRPEAEEERNLDLAVKKLRIRLRITRSDGFLLSTERLPWWGSARRFVVLQLQLVEAAARIELLQDFDLNHFNALCVFLEGDRERSSPTRFFRNGRISISSLEHEDLAPPPRLKTPQHEALCDWIVDISKQLISVKLEPRRSATFAAKKNEEDSSEQRFGYFLHRICKVQVWEGDNNQYFQSLKGAVHVELDRIAEVCNARLNELLREPGGSDLVSFGINIPLDQGLDLKWAEKSSKSCIDKCVPNFLTSILF